MEGSVGVGLGSLMGGMLIQILCSGEIGREIGDNY